MRLTSIRFLASALSLAMAACSSTPSDVPPAVRPGGEPRPAVPDYSAVTSSDEVRARVSGIELHSEAVGILYATDGTAHSFIELDTGRRVDFNLNDSSLTVDGVRQPRRDCLCVKSTVERQWWVLTAGTDTAVVVIEK